MSIQKVVILTNPRKEAPYGDVFTIKGDGSHQMLNFGESGRVQFYPVHKPVIYPEFGGWAIFGTDGTWWSNFWKKEDIPIQEILDYYQVDMAAWFSS